MRLRLDHIRHGSCYRYVSGIRILLLHGEYWDHIFGDMVLQTPLTGHKLVRQAIEYNSKAG